jgi:anaerobic carbon-monoxide dehydrogenase iron sulfur subunit
MLKMSKILVVNPDLCIGCRMCEAICSLVHHGGVGISYARLKVIRYDQAAFFNPVVCAQCEDPYCAAACPSRAISKDRKTGVVKVAAKKCTGCKACIGACPFGAMKFIDSKATKCDLCGGKPSCVEFCQAKALTYGEPADIGDTAAAAFSDRVFQACKDRLSQQKQ